MPLGGPSQFRQGGRMDSVSWKQLLMDFPMDFSQVFSQCLVTFPMNLYWIEMFRVSSLSMFTWHLTCAWCFPMVSLWIPSINGPCRTQFAFVGTGWQTPGRRGENLFVGISRRIRIKTGVEIWIYTAMTIVTKCRSKQIYVMNICMYKDIYMHRINIVVHRCSFIFSTNLI